jgi:hypothetical protein
MVMGLDEVPWADLRHNYGSAADVPALLAALTDPDRCQQAISDLDAAIYHQGGWICSAATAVVPFLAALAADATVGCRADIVELLGSLVAEAGRVEPRWVDGGWPAAWAGSRSRLLGLLDDPAPAVRRAVAEALSHDSDPAGEVVGALRARWDREPDLSVRLQLILAVGEQASVRTVAGAGAELAWLRGLTAHADAPVRLAAAIAARQAAPDPAGTALIIHALGEPGLGACPGVVPVWPSTTALVASVGWELADDPDAQVRLAVTLLGHAEPERRRGAAGVAAEVLSRWRSATDRLLPLLADHLADPDVEVRAYAASLLAAVGRPARGYADQLAALLADTAATEIGGYMIGDIVLWGLARLGDPRCVSGLAARLTGPRLGFGLTEGLYVGRDSPYWLEPPGIHEVLALVPEHAPALLPTVGYRLRTEPTLEARRAFVQAAAAWGPAAAPLVPALADLLDGDAAGWAAEALAAIGPAAASTVGRLRRLARGQHHDDRVRLAAAAATAQVGAGADVALEVIGPALRTQQAAAAARHLAELGLAGAVHAGVLRDLLADPNRGPVDWVTVEAAHALWRVTGDPTDAVAALARTVEHGVSGHTAYPAAQRAVRYLAAIGQPAATAAVPHLRSVLADDRRLAYFGGWRAFTEDEQLRLHAATALADTTDGPARRPRRPTA